MSQALHDNDNSNDIAIPWVFSENSRAKNYLSVYQLSSKIRLIKNMAFDLICINYIPNFLPRDKISN